METLTVQNGENFVFPKVSIMLNGELKFEIEEPIVETQSKPKKDCIKYKTHCKHSLCFKCWEEIKPQQVDQCEYEETILPCPLCRQNIYYINN